MIGDIMETLFAQLPLFLLILIFIVSLIGLTKSADLLVENAVKIAEAIGIPELIIGATIVSLGTTLPEVATSITSIINGSAELALGNAVGSIVTNMTLVLGVGALAGLLPVAQSVAKNFSIFFGFSLLLILASFNQIPTKFPMAAGNIPNVIGWIFLLALPVYLMISFRKSKSTTKISTETARPHQSLIKPILLIFLAALLVAFFASTLVSSVKTGARLLGVPETIIGATIVALGTSLPELTTIFSAAKKGYGALAVGNVLGANILNLLLVLGLSIAINPGGMPVPAVYFNQIFPIMLLTLITLAIFIYNSKIKVISRKEGIWLLFIYLVYLILNTH
ncbi:calcium/sodium antiporter [Lapidilactobacillus dextrinicus]|uniref:calcium/sodium antiporter n=1 Tax=Lapidilactobacillus dextrinicus TaxID=51664 RepID=UPI003F1EB0A7